MKHRIFSKYIALILTLTLFYVNSSYATHAMATDLTYVHISGSTYKFTYRFYRDCSGTGGPLTQSVFDGTAAKAYISGCNSMIDSLKLSPISIRLIQRLCTNFPTTCTGGTESGLQELIYEGTYTFPSVCANWEVGINACCRNGSITNLLGNSSNFSLYTSCTVNNSVTNSSPVFQNLPVAYVPIGNLFTYSHSAIDAEGDLLVYSLTTPLGGETTNYMPSFVAPIPFTSGFTAESPISTTSGVAFATNTGQISFFSNTTQVSVLAVLVQEYRNGLLIGTIRRDMQIQVSRGGNNTLPQFGAVTNISGTNFTVQGNSGTFTTCAGKTMSFSLPVTDANEEQTIEITTNTNTLFPNAITTIINGSSNTKIFNFSWTPTSSDAGTRIILINAKDSYCPVFGFATQGFAITINPITPPTLEVIPPSCAQAQNGEIYVGAQYDPSLTYAWESSNTGEFADTTGTTSGALQGLGAGTYTVTVKNALGCTATASATITAPANACFTCDKTNAPRELSNWDFQRGCSATITDTYWWWRSRFTPPTCGYVIRTCTTTTPTLNNNSEWFTVFGTPNIVSVSASTNGDDPPTNAMQLSADNSFFKRRRTRVSGESFAQCFKFEKNVSYRVCCRMRRDIPDTETNKMRKAAFFMYAANNVYESTPKNCIEVFNPATITEKQLIFAEDVNISTYSTTTEWKYLTTTFTPTQDFGEVWCYLDYIDGWESIAYIDDIRIFPTASGKCCEEKDCIASLRPIPSKKYVVSAWVREDYTPENEPIAFNSPQITLGFNHQTAVGLSPQPPAQFSFKATGPIIEGWQRVWGEFTVPEDAVDVQVLLENTAASPNDNVFFDDIRILPYDGKLKSFVYDPVTLRLVAEMDENNYGTFYEYDKAGALERVKRETERGIKTIKEARSGSVKK